MKIGVLLRVLWPSAVPKTAIKQAKGLMDKGHLTHLVIWRESDYKYKFEHLLHGLPTSIILRGRMARLSELFNYIIFYPLMPFYRSRESAIDVQLFLLLPLMLRSKYDILICHDQIASFVGLLTKKLFGTPYISYVYEPLELTGPSTHKSSSSIAMRLVSKILDILVKVIQKEASAIVASSMPMYEWLLNKTANKRIVWIQEGCDVQEFIKPIEERENVVLTVSRWDKGRNPSFFLDIAEKVSNAKFIIAGSWTPKSFKNEFITEVRRRGLSDKVIVMSDTSSNVIHELYMNAKAVVRWGTEKGVPTAILEGISYGCPIVTNEEVGGSSLLKHGIHGYIAKKMDANEFAHHINSILRDEKLAKKMSSNCKHLSLIYSWDKHVSKLNTLVLEILSASKKRRTC